MTNNFQFVGENALDSLVGVQTLNATHEKYFFRSLLPKIKTSQMTGLYFLYIAKAMAYHHALACISSALTSISRQSEYIISRRLYALSQ